MENQETDLKRLLEALVPPSDIAITDIFGDTHNLPSVVSARKQIKLARILEFVKDYEVPAGIDVSNGAGMVELILSVVQDDKVLDALKECFEVAHPELTRDLLAKATEEEVVHDDILDLLPIEGVAGAIIPLFLRAAQKGLVALQTLSTAQQTV